MRLHRLRLHKTTTLASLTPEVLTEFDHQAVLLQRCVKDAEGKSRQNQAFKIKV